LRNDYKEDSDLGVLVEIDGPLSLIGFIGLENYLGDTLGIKVDLSEKKNLKKYIGQYILKEVKYI